MSDSLTKSQIEDLVTYCGSAPTMWRDTDMLVCCPVHGEHNPSMGISVDKQVFHCFSCGEKGDFAWLLYRSLPDEFKSYRQAHDFLIKRYEIEYRELDYNTLNIKRYEEYDLRDKNERIVLPKFKLAPFKSGKETYKYFFDRGFTKTDVETYMIGRDLENRTVTIPAFFEDGELAGVIGRYISKHRKHNERYKIYNNFTKGSVLYPLNLFQNLNDSVILVEGMLDAIVMRNLGYTNTLAKMGVELTSKQCDILCNRCNRVIDFCDNDERGLGGRDKDQKRLKGKLDFMIVDYPKHGKDPEDWSSKEIRDMIENAHNPLVRSISRYE